MCSQLHTNTHTSAQPCVVRSGGVESHRSARGGVETTPRGEVAAAVVEVGVEAAGTIPKCPLGLAQKESTQARTPKQAKQTRQCAAARTRVMHMNFSRLLSSRCALNHPQLPSHPNARSNE